MGSAVNLTDLLSLKADILKALTATDTVTVTGHNCCSSKKPLWGHQEGGTNTELPAGHMQHLYDLRVVNT